MLDARKPTSMEGTSREQEEEEEEEEKDRGC